MNRKQEKRFWSADQKRFVYSLGQLFLTAAFYIYLKKEYGYGTLRLVNTMRDRTEH